MSVKLRWGIIGTGSIARTFASGLAHSKTGRLIAVGSRSQSNAEQFADEFKINKAYASYETLLADTDVDAVYISTPHPSHAEWSIKAAEAGKHILCEKPMTINAGEAMAVIEAARRHDVFLMEAFMYRCHPLTERLVELLRSRKIGDVRVIRATFGFDAGYNLQSRLLNNALGGGGILDVGCYTASITRLIAGVAQGGEIAEPIEVTGAGHVGPESQSDEWACASLKFDGGIIAQLASGVRANMGSDIVIFGSEGQIELDTPWFGTGREGGSSCIRIYYKNGQKKEVKVHCDEWLYAIEADCVARHINNRINGESGRQASFPAMTWNDSLGNMKTLDRWRQAIGMVYDSEKDENLVIPVHQRPLVQSPAYPMAYGDLPGVSPEISRLIMGVDNQPDLRYASVIFDDFFEQGGNCFDTAYIYRREHLLGKWIENRNIRNQVVIIGKGGHTPKCYPDAVTEQLMRSLDNLRTDYVDIYFLHRDNPDVPVGEFIDVLNEHIHAGRIKSFGGSNWSIPRIEQANEYANRNGKTGMAAVSNNFSLAQMIEAPWRDCLSHSDPDSIEWHTRTQIPLMSWSSQARGFFAEGRANPDIHQDKELVRCWYSDDNFRRLQRARQLAKEKGVKPINIALAYVLAQPFPTYAIVGPRTMQETWSCLTSLRIHLTKEETEWLNLLRTEPTPATCESTTQP